ncbi:MAG: hypothetical protein Q8M83_05095 [bacterium]|nr:hypothetical protein [bacterium]
MDETNLSLLQQQCLEAILAENCGNDEYGNFKLRLLIRQPARERYRSLAVLANAENDRAAIEGQDDAD